ncbi:MAG TPA: toprim domain-containing protein, partial [Verrucomicrobiae bacterium]|nr:toprim domain-containing protein [Verrucomicrobiae bacterium]
STIIYGLYQAKQNIRKENRALLVEGNMDVIACHQAGFSQTVASSGTAITVQQLSILQRLCENLIFAFDSDSAGSNATKRALEAALSLGFNVKIVDLGSAKDPDELIKKGIGIWQKAVDSAPHYVEFFYNQLFKQHDPNSVDGKRQITKELTPLIYRISDSVTKAHFIRKLATGINIPEQTILDLLKKVSLPKVQTKEVKPTIKKDRKVILEERLLGLTLNLENFEQLKDFKEEDFEEENREVFRCFKASSKLKLADLKKNFPNLSSRFDLISFSAQVETEQQGLEPQKELIDTALELKRITLKKRMEQITTQMTEAERAKDKEKLKALSVEFSQLMGQLSQIP